MNLSFDSEIQFLPGIGPERAKALQAAGIFNIRQLLYYFPRKYLDRTRMVKISQIPKIEGTVTILGQVAKAELLSNKGKGGQRLTVFLKDDSGMMELVFFQGISWIKQIFKEGEAFAVFGEPQRYGPRYSIVHPEYEHLKVEDGEVNLLHTGGIVPLYPSGDVLKKVGFDSRGFRRVFKNLFDKIDMTSIPDPIPLLLREKFKLSDLGLCLKQIHQPENNDQLQSALYRLKMDEILYFQLRMLLQKLGIKNNEKGLIFSTSDNYTKQFFKKLPFNLTASQVKVLQDIRKDLSAGQPMNRLVQGDVGSGKTVVGIIAMLMAVDNGYQAAFMAPTEILAEQHYHTLKKYIEPLGLEIIYLTGSVKNSTKNSGIAMLQSGMAQLAVGTHALIEDDVLFNRLGLIVIDEQHRFGVMQRAKLRQKGIFPHVLIMTATPIPRTLSMTVYGDLDVSRMMDMPTGRIPIKTKMMTDKDKPRLNSFVMEQLQSGHQIYFVYPLIEESEKLELKAATDAYNEISKDFPDHSVGLLHGRLSASEKEDVMAKFKSGTIQILVSTTVIEVGVDVPNANLMVIEHAERFGLAQLHQLRGRVGRGVNQSYCILMTSYKISQIAKDRLKIMEETTDGFRIAEEDLKIRGTGDIFGTRQSGLPDFKLLSLVNDEEIIFTSVKLAQDILADDPHLRKPEHIGLRKKMESEENKVIMLNEVG